MTNAPTAALWVLQKGIYAQLRNSFPLQELIGDPVRIFDDPPPDTAFPYLTIGEARTRSFDGIDGAMEHDVSIHVFSRYAGRREIKRILDGVYEALHDAQMQLTDHCLISLRFVFADIFRRSDGAVYQGVIRFRALTQPEPETV